MKRGGLLALIIVLLGGAIIAGAAFGAAELTLSDVWNASLSKLPFINQYAKPVDESTLIIVWNIRLPRAILAALVGAALSLAGTAFQGLFRNPLADPYIVGVSSGAAVGGALATLLGVATLFSGFGGAGFAFAFAMAGMGIVYSVARTRGMLNINSFLLAGVAVGSAMWSVITLLLMAADTNFDLILNWLMGSFADKGWEQVAVVAVIVAFGWLALQWQARGLNVFTLGDESAQHLGVNINQLKNSVLIAGSVITAAAVSVCGIIGFTGLIVPHIARRLVGPDHRKLFPFSALIGALLMVCADVPARLLLAPAEIPVGIVTALVGTPFFVYLLKSASKQIA